MLAQSSSPFSARGGARGGSWALLRLVSEVAVSQGTMKSRLTGRPFPSAEPILRYATARRGPAAARFLSLRKWATQRAINSSYAFNAAVFLGSSGGGRG